LEKLHFYVLFFEEHGIFPTVGQKTYECRVCSTSTILVDVKKLKANLFVSQKKKHPFVLSQSQVWYFGGETPIVIERVQRIRPKVY